MRAVVAALNGDWSGRPGRASNTILSVVSANGLALVAGDNGRGKSVMAARVALAMLAAERTVVYRQIHAVPGEIMDSAARFRSDPSIRPLRDRMLKCGLLILDDCNANSLRHMEQGVLDIVKQRYDYELPSIVIGHATTREQAEAIFTRDLLSRSTEDGRLILIGWGDLRRDPVKALTEGGGS